MKMISLTCPRCDAPLEVAEGRQMYFCPYCGNKILMDDESQTINIHYTEKSERVYRNIDEAGIAAAEAGSKKEKYEMITLLGYTGLCCFMLLVVFGYMFISDMHKYKPVTVTNAYGDEETVQPVKVRLKYSESELVGESVEDVKAYFESEGFFNIKTVPHNKGFLWDEGEVCEVTIDGYSINTNNDYITSEEVVISYHSKEVFKK